MLAALAKAGWVAETAALDSTYVKAHRSTPIGFADVPPGDWAKPDDPSPSSAVC